MNDIRILENLFNNKYDEMSFQNFSESIIIKINNNNKNDYSNQKLIFNTQKISSKLIDYSNSYILFEFKATIAFNANDTENVVKNTFALRTSDDIIDKFLVTLNNVIIPDETDCDKSNLINFILNNANTNNIGYRNLRKIDNVSTINVNNDKFLLTSNIATDDIANHEIIFKIPIFLKDINNLFRKIDLIHFGEFDITLSYKNPFIFTRANSNFNIESAFLYVNKIELNESDNIKYLKMLASGYTKKINFLENNVRKFTNITNGNQDFNIHNVRNCNSLYFCGILNTRIDGNLYKLPNKAFKNINCFVDNIRIDNGIPNDSNSYMILKDKSIDKDDSLINYPDFINNYRVYSFNLDRVIKNDNSNKFINITCQSDSDEASTVYAIFKTYVTITMKLDKTNGLIVCKNY